MKAFTETSSVTKLCKFRVLCMEAGGRPVSQVARHIALDFTGGTPVPPYYPLTAGDAFDKRGCARRIVGESESHNLPFKAY